MPLKRGEALGFAPDRLVYTFSMMDGEKVVHCEISNVALSDLAGNSWGTVQSGDRELQFLKWRDDIEKVAADLFDAGNGQVDYIRIFAKHFLRRKN